MHPEGRVTEIVDEGVTGSIVNSMEEAIAAVPKVIALDRAKVRKRFEARFSAIRMASDYVDVYRKLVASAPCIEEDSTRLRVGGRSVEAAL